MFCATTLGGRVYSGIRIIFPSRAEVEDEIKCKTGSITRINGHLIFLKVNEFQITLSLALHHSMYGISLVMDTRVKPHAVAALPHQVAEASVGDKEGFTNQIFKIGKSYICP